MIDPTRTQPDWRLAIGLAISLLIHLVALAAIVGGSGAGRPDLSRILEPQRPDETPLGIEHSKTVSVAWLGFETPTEHRAPRSAVEQSQLELDPGLRGAIMPERIARIAAASEQARRAAQAATAALESLAAQAAEAIQLARAQPAQPPTSPTAPADPTDPTTPAEPSAADGADSGVAGEGDGAQATKEADATSLEEPLEARFGQVAVGPGLEISTRRNPRLTTLIRRIARPRSPLVDISFQRDGTVKQAVFRGGGTGYVSVDEPLLDALYSWRARGPRIDALGEDETVTVAIRVLLD